MRSVHEKYYKLADGRRNGTIVVQRTSDGKATETLESRFHNLGGNLLYPRGSATAIRLKGLQWVDPSYFDIDVGFVVDTDRYV